MTEVMEGTRFNKWLVEIGQPVKKKEALAELGTEHYDYEYMSETDGFLVGKCMIRTLAHN